MFERVDVVVRSDVALTRDEFKRYVQAVDSALAAEVERAVEALGGYVHDGGLVHAIRFDGVTYWLLGAGDEPLLKLRADFDRQLRGDYKLRFEIVTEKP